MNLQVLALCDAATDTGGKLNILGVFDTLVATQTPVTHPQCAIALRAVFGRADEGRHVLKVLVVDADGKPVINPFEMPVDIHLPPGAYMLSRNFIVNIIQLRFDRAGQYAIDILLDGAHAAGIPFEVRCECVEL